MRGRVAAVLVIGVIATAPTNWVRADATATPASPAHAVAEPGDGRVLVMWDAPSGLDVTPAGYLVTATPGDIVLTLGADARSALLTGLTNGVAYTIDVQARASAGTTSPSVHLTAVPDTYACPPRPDRPRCQSLFRSAASAGFGPAAAAAPIPGTKTPQDLAAAYGFAWTIDASSETVAIVDAFDDPTAEDDLSAYRSQYGLPACTSANGCFRKVDQNGGTAYPSTAPPFTWQLEISLDLDMVSASCPTCHILLVETSDDTWPNLLAGEDAAFALGATAISDSWGSPELPQELAYDTHFTHDGVPITAATGDSGTLDYPAASPYVTAVGGTRMTCVGCESAWPQAGHGCSAYETAPPWQAGTGCTSRAGADVAAIADPGDYGTPLGVSIYDSVDGGWFDAGGTSVGAPIIAATYAVAATTSGPARHHSDAWAANPWRTASTSYLGDTPSSTPYLHDVTAGPGAAVGYDQPTGLGTPNGITAFQSSLVYRAVALTADGRSGYALDGYGGLHPLGGAPPVSNGPYWPGWDIARGLVLCTTNPSIAGGYVLDGQGGVHGFGNEPSVTTRAYWPGADIARGIVLRNDCESGYVLDAHGGIHAFAAAGMAMPDDWPVGDPAYWTGRDIARAIVLRGQGCAAALPCDNASGYVLDGTGGIHPFGGAPAVTVAGDWNGRDIARCMVLVTDGENPLDALQGVGGYVADGSGGLHVFSSGAPTVPATTTGTGSWPGLDVTRGLAIDPRDVDSAGVGGQALVDGVQLSGYGATYSYAAALGG